MRLGTWNVNGIRARYDEVVAWAKRERLDLFCLQEIKAAPAQVPEPLTGLPDYHNDWHGAPGGYSGVSIHVRRSLGAPELSHPPFDMETRAVEARVDGRRVLSLYVPNGNKDPDAKLAFLDGMVDYFADSPMPTLVVGDLNVARSDRDVHENFRNDKTIGQTPAERERFERLLAGGFVDLGGRYAHSFTWWPPWREEKAKDRGWRIDYVLADPTTADQIESYEVLRDYGTSDHAPVVVELRV